ncbi:hypothetical protein GCM10007304_12320 [Rhodococcoides trifolii]|uniref:Calpastatin n=1 Tax=Rhodococcoides trifolii TaxID=908250 RepID=A0A917CYF2_9NOCA|nr:DUF1810 domain-containing protein [Rhodococcus trifolii]GGF99930.1 hypothetical protein GCM10007304_12320 [Rhodococcus trifolii]
MTDVDITRFTDAQETVYETALAELKAERKRSHWMWFVFPQIAGLGMTATSQFFAIANKAEAVAYLAHPILGARLRECSQALLDSTSTNISAILGSPDDLKLRSSMTLFAQVAENETLLDDVIAKFYDGPDSRTLELLDT